jgi:hypothetical protein
MFTILDTMYGEWGVRKQKRSGAIARVLPVALLLALMAPAAARADFGFEPASARVTAISRDGSPDLRAGSHPYELVFQFNLNTEANGFTVGGQMRDILTEFPPGFVGDPAAIPSCPRKDLESITPACPGDTQVGVVQAVVPGIGAVDTALFNMRPAPGQAARLGFSLFSNNLFQDASVDSEKGYALDVGTFAIPLEVSSVKESVWGVPPDPGHDAERECPLPEKEGERGKIVKGCASTVAPGVFLTQPANCESPESFTFRADSLAEAGVFAEETVISRDGAGQPRVLSGCESVPFSPNVTATPTSTAPDSASGLDFELKLPDQGLLSPNGISEAEPVKTEVLLPEGVTINPSAAGGLAVCTPAQYRAAGHEPGQGCPESSKVGTLLAKTPLLEEAIEGSVYLAAPHDNPFNSLLALYIVAKAPERGVLIKQAGEVVADPATGQLTSTFADLPPLPYSSFALDLRGGPRAPLTTPSACGSYSTVTRLYPSSDPSTRVERSSSFQIIGGVGGSGCPASEAQAPNSPSFEAGTTAPSAGAYSPFVLKLTREDGSQRLSALNVTLPPGLTGKIAGVAQCSDAQLAGATARGGFGEGALEQASPSCPVSSEVGTVTVGTGSGTPLYVGGHAYLAGPYEGAPFSLAIVTPAIAGPFDLGVVVVRSALFINPETAQVTVKSDPLPTILEGIPLDIRSIALSISRPEFMLNPTSCETLTLSGQAISTTGQTAPLSNRFQVGGCSGLAFKPVLSASTQAKASRSDGASLTVKIAAKPGEANIRKVNLELPVKLPSRLSTLQKSCTEAQFNANPAGCPADSVIGSAVAHTPILQAPLSGPAYLVSHGGAAFPDVEFVLQADERGGHVEIVLDGGTQIKNGITHSNFETVPDAPISSFESVFPEGPHSILAAVLPASANDNLCGQGLLMPTTLTGQNGAVVKQSTPIEVTGCAPAITVSSHSVSGKTATLVVRVPSAGKLVASGTGLTAATKAVTAARSVTIKVSLTGKEQAFLAHHPHRKLKLRVRLRFAPKKGSMLSSSVSVLIG